MGERHQAGSIYFDYLWVYQIPLGKDRSDVKPIDYNK